MYAHKIWLVFLYHLHIVLIQPDSIVLHTLHPVFMYGCTATKANLMEGIFHYILHEAAKAMIAVFFNFTIWTRKYRTWMTPKHVTTHMSLTEKPVLPFSASLSTAILKRWQNLVLKSSRMSVSISRADSLATENNRVTQVSQKCSKTILCSWGTMTGVILYSFVPCASY